MQQDSSPISPRSRPIHPLPKRSLRERLSPEVAKTIQYPPLSPPAESRIFSRLSPILPSPDSSSPKATSPWESRSTLQRAFEDIPSSLESYPTLKNTGATRSFSESISVVIKSGSQPPIATANGTRRYSHPIGLANTSLAQISSVLRTPIKSSSKSHLKNKTLLPESYEATENPNNKKKRKIPAMGEAISPVMSFESDSTFSSLKGLSSGVNDSSKTQDGLSGDDASVGSYISTSIVPATKGISGPGRGMFGRGRGRGSKAYLRSSNHPATWLDHRTTGIGPVPASAIGGPSGSDKPRFITTTPSTSPSKPGIISAAIAKAEQNTSSLGQDQVSLLTEQSTKVVSSTSDSKFTFTCQNPDVDYSTLKWDSVPSYMSPPPEEDLSMMNRTMQHGTESIRILPQDTAPPPTAANSPVIQERPRTPITRSQKLSAKRRARRLLDQELADQARQRRIQHRRRLLKKPNPDEEYICLFCDYEKVYGEPPMSFIRSFELKARQERIDEENKKRRLEQAKARTRKGKKATAGKKSDASGRPDHGDDVEYDDAISQRSQSEDDLSYDEDDPDPYEYYSEDSYEVVDNQEGLEVAHIEQESGDIIEARVRDFSSTVGLESESGGGRLGSMRSKLKTKVTAC